MLALLAVASTLCSIGGALLLPAKPRALPWEDTVAGQRAVVLLRGEIFRWYDPVEEGPISCSSDANATIIQYEALDSLKEHIISPLETLYRSVDVVVAVSFRPSVIVPNCSSRISEYLDRLGQDRIIHSQLFEATSQRISLRRAMDALQTAATPDVAEYDLVLVARHDLVYWGRSDFLNWEGDLSRFNFQCTCDRCWQKLLPGLGSTCRTDLIWAMPGSAFEAFYATVGQPGSQCFEPTASLEICRDSGHCCYSAMKDAMESIGGVGELWKNCHLGLTELSNSLPRNESKG